MLSSLLRTLLALAVASGVADAASSGSALGLLRGSLHKDDPAVAPWTPPPTYGADTVGHKTMYLADVRIGSAGQTFRLLVDTGSSMVVVPGAACQQRQNRFDVSKAQARSGNMTMSVQYGLGKISGHVFEDRVCVQAPEGSAPLSEVGFLQQDAVTTNVAATRAVGDDPGEVCAEVSFLVADQESDNFASEPFEGILGLGLESAAESRFSGNLKHGFSILSQLASDGTLQSAAFAMHLSNSGSSQLLLGSVDESKLAGGAAVWVPLSPVEDGSWQFTVQDLMLDGKHQNIGSLQVAVDSGTSLLAADAQLANWLRTRLLPSNCNEVDSLPKFGLKLEAGSILSMLPADYINQEDGDCKLALMPSPLHPVNGQRLILGDSFLRRYVTIYDRQNQRLGFGVASDDTFAKQILPALFPTPVTVTTQLMTTTEGPPPPTDIDYKASTFAPPSTTPLLTAKELQKAQSEEDAQNAFGGLGDDLVGSFEAAKVQETHKMSRHHKS